MKKNIIGFCLLLLVFAVYSCAPKTMTPVEWRYEESAIRLHVNADPLLNLYDDKPHALHVCVYQLRDPNAFNQLAETPEGISDLLQCSLFDSGVVNARILSRLGVQPEDSLPLNLDRAEGAKYLGIVAGYQVLEKERTVRLLNIPVVVEKVRKGLFKIENVQRPGILKVDLYLGPRQIERAVVMEGYRER
jgi:type VI secretion system VasD/TssJ family lipoprotein